MQELFGIDVRAPFTTYIDELGVISGHNPNPIPQNHWDGVPTDDFFGREYSFHIPAGLVETIYGSDRWPLGS
jgi:hypothetical protein